MHPLPREPFCLQYIYAQLYSHINFTRRSVVSIFLLLLKVMKFPNFEMNRSEQLKIESFNGCQSVMYYSQNNRLI